MTEAANPELRWTKPLAALVAAFALYQIAYLAFYLMRHAPAAPLFGDFFAFWSFARFVHAAPAAQIYDTQTLQAFQSALPGGFNGYYPCPYPPILLLILAPLGWLDYLPACAAWTILSLGAYAVAMAGRDWRSPQMWLAIAAPTTLLAIVAGQNGLLTAALIVGGFRLMRRRPILGGALLGVLAFKPQLFILLPLVLLAGGRWRALVGMGVSALGLVALSAALFGVDAWTAWLHALPDFARQLEARRHELAVPMPTLAAGLLDAGVSPGLAKGLQLLAAVAVAAILAVIFRRAAREASPPPLDVAALQVGVFLATPYAFVYDLPVVTSAIVAVAAFAARTRRPWRPGETTVLLAALLLPVVLLSPALKGWLVGPLVLALLMALIVRAGAKPPQAENRAVIR